MKHYYVINYLIKYLITMYSKQDAEIYQKENQPTK